MSTRRSSYDALKDDDDIHEADIVVGMELRGSVVVRVRHEIKETEDRYKLKKFIMLLNGIELISTYIKTKMEGLTDLELMPEISLSPMEVERLKNLHKKDDSDARAKARALLEQRKKGGPPPEKPKTITLRVNMPDGRTIQVLDVKPTDNVQDVKQRIDKLEGIPPKDQRLVFKGKELENPNSTMDDNDIKDMSTLDLLEPTFAIKVKTPQGNTVSVPGVKTTDTVNDIKNKIKDQGVPIDGLWLLHDGNMLDDPTETMGDRGIKEGSTLELKEPPFEINVKMPDGKTVKISGVKKTDTVKDIKDRIKDQEGIPVKDQKLTFNGKELDDPKSTMEDKGIKDGSTLELLEPTFTVKVKTPDGKVVKIPDVKKTDTVKDLKDKIKDQGAPVDGLWLMYNSDKLDDPDKTMGDHNIKDGSTLNLVEPTFTVKVKSPDGKVAEIPGVKKTDTVKDLKTKINDQEGIPVDALWLLYDGNKLDDPNKTMGDHGIKDGSTLDLVEPTFTVKVKSPDGKVSKIPGVKKTDTVKDLKDKIKEQGIPVDGLWMMYNGDKLDDPDKTMGDHNIKDGSTLDLVEPTFTVNVKSPDGKVSKIPGVKKTDTVNDLKDKIKDQGIPVDGLWMMYNGDKLDDPDKTMGDHNIKDGSTLDLVEPTFTVKVKSPDGKVSKIPGVKKTDTVNDLKDKTKEQGIPVDGLWMMYNGDKLDDPDKTMGDHNIKDGSTLDLVEPTFTVNVKSPDGKVSKIPGVKKTDTVNDLKDKIKDQGIPVDGLWMMYNGDKLDDPDKTMGDHNIKDGSTLDLVEPTFTVKVKSPDGKVSKIPGVKKTDTVKDLKDKIKEQGVPVDGLWMMYNGDKLDDPDKTMGDHNIKDGSELDLLDPTFTVNVKSPDGKVSKIPGVKKTDTVNDLKDKIKDQGIPVDGLWMMYNGDKLDDPDKTMGDHNIKDGSTLDLVEPTFTVKVKTPDGKVAKIPGVKKTDTVNDLKDKIKEQGVPVDGLWMMYNVDKLDDPDKTMGDHGIKDGSELDLLEPTFAIKVKTPDGKTLNIPGAKKTDTVNDIKKKVEDQEGIPVKDQRLTFQGKPLADPVSTLGDHGITDGATLELEPMQIQVRTFDGKMIPLVVKPSDTIQSVKKMVVPAEPSLPSEEYVQLLFKGKEMQDPDSLDKCNIEHGSVLDLGPMQVEVKRPDGKVVSVPTNPLEKIKALKKRIAKQEGIPVDDQRLFFKDEELQDDPTLHDYKIRPGSQLVLKDTMEIQVRTEDGKIIPLAVKPTQTIADVKTQLVEKTKIPVDEQQLKKGKKELDDDGKNLKDCDVKDGTVLDLVVLRKGMQIHVEKEWDGIKFSLDVEKKELISSVKDKIKAQEGIPISQQHLAFKGLALEADQTLFLYNIKHDALLKLEKMKIFVRTGTGKFTLTDIEPGTSIGAIKEMVEKKSKIPPKEQKLSYGHVKLEEDSKTLADHDIRHKSTLTLDKEEEIPEYDVSLSDWQGAFEFKGKDGIKHVGKRKKKPLGKEY